MPIHFSFLENFVSRYGKIAAATREGKTVKGGRHLTPPPLVVDLSVYLANKLGRQLYETISKLFGLQGFRTMQKFRSKCELRFRPGVQHEIISRVAPERYGKHWVIASGDGTRISRFIDRLDSELVGVAHSPCFSKWPKSSFPVPQAFDDLAMVVQHWRSRSLLAAEVHTELLSPITDPVDAPIPSLPVVIHPEPSQGNSGFLTFQNWVHLYQTYAKANLNCVGTATDSCSVGVSAAKIQGSPHLHDEGIIWDVNNNQKIPTGVRYLGLPDDETYQYYGVYFTSKGDGTRSPPQIWYGEAAHLARTFRRNVASMSNALVFQTTTIGGVEGASLASFHSLKLIANAAHITSPVGLSFTDIVSVNEWRDQKSDAAWSLISLQAIDLLKKVHPEDTATALAMQAMFFLLEPFKNKEFTDPYKIVEYVWRGAAVWDIQEQYVKDEAKINLDLHTPSPAFRDTVRLMVPPRPLLFSASMCAISCRTLESDELEPIGPDPTPARHHIFWCEYFCVILRRTLTPTPPQAYAATNHVLAFYHDGIPEGKTWDQVGLAKCNSDILEGLHGQGVRPSPPLPSHAVYAPFVCPPPLFRNGCCVLVARCKSRSHDRCGGSSATQLPVSTSRLLGGVASSPSWDYVKT